MNSMCKDCAHFGHDCKGEGNPVYTGCVKREEKKK